MKISEAPSAVKFAEPCTAATFAVRVIMPGVMVEESTGSDNRTRIGALTGTLPLPSTGVTLSIAWEIKQGMLLFMEDPPGRVRVTAVACSPEFMVPGNSMLFCCVAVAPEAIDTFFESVYPASGRVTFTAASSRLNLPVLFKLICRFAVPAAL